MTSRTRVAYSLALTSIAAAFALGGCASSNTASEISSSPSASKKKPSATSTPSPTYTRKSTSPTPTPSPTKSKTPVPEFIANLPATVNAVVGQEVIVQMPTEADDKYTASASGPVTLSGPRFNPPPPEQPDAPGTTIATVKVKDTGKATVTFVSAKGKTKKLTIQAK